MIAEGQEKSWNIEKLVKHFDPQCMGTPVVRSERGGYLFLEGQAGLLMAYKYMVTI